MVSPDGRDGTALITGAARGIGAAFVARLALTHNRLVLVDKDRQALEALPSSIDALGQIEVELIEANLARAEDQNRVIQCVEQGEPLSLLVNNAGFGAPALFHEQDPQVQLDMLQVHVLTSVRLCRATLPAMAQAGRGNIVIVSSLAAELPVYGNVMYGATKGFLRSFAEILRVECDGCGVNVQLLVPGYTRTGFHATPDYQGTDFSRVPEWAWSTPEAVVEASLRALAKRRFVCVPGLHNRCVYLLLRSHCVPKGLIRRFLV